MLLRNATILCISTLVLSACGGTRLVKGAPAPSTIQQPLATSTDASLTANLDWVIVRNAPGSWVKNANWDEYLVRVHNNSKVPVQITHIAVTDSQGQQNTPMYKRTELVRASKQTARRYKADGIKVKAGVSNGRLAAMGLGATAAGVGYASTLSLGIMGGASSSSAAFGAAAGLIVAGPVLATVAIVRGVNNSKVDKRISARYSMLPASVAPGQTSNLDLFFPLSPAPLRLQISYQDDLGEHQVMIDTHEALSGLHLTPESSDMKPASEASTISISNTQVDP